MKSFLISLALLTFAVSAILLYFRKQVRMAALEVLIQITKTDISPAASTSTKSESGGPAMASSVPKWVPPGFKGPTGQPHINGPTSPPPNY